ncbi:hypothetical protein AHIS2_p041 [Acaryochloris phage A-HIS2]|nr:hypothetical protein AHIS2_p041 [Acaryochloris phage A-HIS2]
MNVEIFFIDGMTKLYWGSTDPWVEDGMLVFRGRPVTKQAAITKVMVPTQFIKEINVYAAG